MNKIDIYKRAEEVGRYVVEHNTTIRLTARNFNVSKSTVHKDITERLEKTNPDIPSISVSLKPFSSCSS